MTTPSDSVVMSILNGEMPYGLVLGFKMPDGAIQISEAFKTNVGNDSNIRDVMVLLANEGLYSEGSSEVLVRNNNQVKHLTKIFKPTNHGKMLAYLSSLQEKQKTEKAVGIIAVIMSPDDIGAESEFSIQGIAQLEEA